MSTSHADKASPREQHQLLYGILKDYYWKLIEFEFKEGTVLLVVFGWILTAQRAQELFASSLPVRMTVTIAIVAIAATHPLHVLRFFRRSARVEHELRKLDYMPSAYHDAATISRPFALLLCSWHFIVCAAFLTIVWLLPTIVGTDIE